VLAAADDWRLQIPFQQSRKLVLGMAHLGTIPVILAIGRSS
jgi:hypothetical protein